MSSKLAYTINDVCKIISVGRTKIYQEIAEGNIKIIKVGHRTLITNEALLNWLKSKEKVTV